MEKGKFMMIIIIVLLVVLLGTVVGVSFYVLNLVKNQAALSGDGDANASQVVRNLNIEETTSFSLGNSITTNLADSVDGSAHIAKIGVLIGYDNSVKDASAAFAETLTAQTDYARSIALACIRKYTYEELNAEDGQAVLSEDIKTKLQDEFNTTLIVKVSFDDWFLQ